MGKLIGSVEERRGALGSTWRLVWRENGTKHYSPTFDTEDEVLRFQAILNGDRAKGIYYNPAAPRTSFEVVAENWLRSHEKRPGYRTARSKLDARILPHWRGSEVGGITYTLVQDWIDALSPLDEDDEEKDSSDINRLPKHLHPVSVSYVQGIYGTFQQVMRRAELDRMLPMGNPLGRGAVKLPSEDTDRRRFLTHAELDHLLEVTLAKFPQWFPVVYVTAYTGMRAQEVFALERQHYNSLRMSIMIEQAWKANYKIGKPKNGKARNVGIDREMKTIIDAQLAGHDSQYVFPVPGVNYPPSQRFGRYHWVLIREAAGFPDLRFHDLRHTHVSHLLAAGIEAHEVADRVGHKSTRMTLDRYGHFIPGRGQSTLERLRASRQQFA